jgi:hypothetical protein
MFSGVIKLSPGERAGSTQKQGCQMVYFQTQKSQFGQILEHLTLEIVDIFYNHFGLFYGH